MKNIRERLKYILQEKGISEGEFEEQAGLSRGYVSNVGDSIREASKEKISKVLPELNINWLITGEGSTLNDNKKETAGLNMTNETAIDTLSDYETWLLPQTAHGGSLTNIPADGVLLQNCEKIVSPIKGVDFAISVYGESMSPEYPSGSRVLIKKIKHNAFIDWGKAYVIDTCNGVILKEVLKCERDGFITCHSINPDPKYADFDVSLDDVYGIYRVLMCLSAK